MPAIILSDNGASSGSAGLKTSGSNDGILALQTSTAGGTATTAVTINTSQNVGVGTTSPTQKLQVLAVNSTGFAGAAIQNQNTNVGIAGVQFSSDTTYFKSAIGHVRNDANGVGSLVFYNASSTGAANWATSDARMTIDSSGNVGIGTTSPSQKLSVVAGSGSSAYVEVQSTGFTSTLFGQNNAGDAYVYNGYAGNIRLWTGGSERARIDSSGVFLVGATSSSGSGGVILKGYSGTSLAYNNNAGVLWSDQGNIVLTSAYASVNFPATASVSNANPYWMTGTVGGAGAGYYINLRSGYSGGGGGDVAAYKITNGGTATAATVTNHIWTVGSGTEAARINASGFFKATNTGGYINASGPYYEFISSDVSVNQTFIVYNNSSSITQDALFFVGAARATTNNTFYAIGYYNYGSSTYKFRVADSGNVTNTNNSYGAISDIKLKENITDATPKLEQLNQVRVVNYNFIGSNEKQLGVIAQELEQIFPGMVEESPDTERVTTVGEDGQEVTSDVPTGTTTKSVKYSVFVPMLIKAIQEQQAIIAQLQADVATLKGQA